MDLARRRHRFGWDGRAVPIAPDPTEDELMPHDKNGTELKAGDVVTIAFTVEEVSANADHCNVKTRTVEPFHPNTDGVTNWFNTKQVVKVEPAAAGFAEPIDVSGQPSAAAFGDGSLIDLVGAALIAALKAALRRRGIITAIAVAALLLGSAGDASAFGRRCGNRDAAPGADRGGPLRNLVGGIADRVQERRAARHEPPAAEAGPAPEFAPAPVTYGALPFGPVAPACPNGRCPRAP